MALMTPQFFSVQPAISNYQNALASFQRDEILKREQMLQDEQMGWKRQDRARDEQAANALSAIFGGGDSTNASVNPAPSDIGVGGDYFAITRAKESGGNDAAKNPNSSASGRYQFIDSTWNNLVEKYPQLGLTRDGKNDPAQQEKAMRAFTAENAQILEKAGIPANGGNLYMAHFLGPAGATNFISAVRQDPSVPAAQLVGPEAAKANRAVFFNRDGSPKSAGEVYSQMTAKFGGSGQQQAPLQVAQAPQAAMSDMPNVGASNAQGFLVPGGGGDAGQSMRLPRSDIAKLMLSPQFRPLALELLKMERQGETGTSDMQEYRLAKKEGFTGSFADWKKQARTTDGGLSLSPVYGTGPDGKPVLMQIGKDGKAVQTQLPEGVQLSGGIEKMDLGTRWGLLDKRSGQIIGYEPKDVAGEEAAKVQGKARGEGIVMAPAAIEQAEIALKTIKQARTHPGRDDFGATGFGSTLPIIGSGLPGSDARGFIALVDQMKGQAFLDAFESLKGGGAITEVEGLKAEQARARLDRAQNEKDFSSALNDLEEIITNGLNRAKSKAGPATQAAAPATAAPAQQTTPAISPGKVLRYNPETGDLE